MIKIEKKIDYIGIIIFTLLIIFWCDLDIQGLLSYTGLNTNLGIGIILSLLIILGILLYKYVSQILGILLFVLSLIITKTMLIYTELFTTTTTTTNPTSTTTTTLTTTTTTTTNPNDIKLRDIDSEIAAEISETEKYLLKQISDDPNTTSVDKRVMRDITERYFKDSSKLAELRDFNLGSESANILPGQQIIVGLGVNGNRH